MHHVRTRVSQYASIISRIIEASHKNHYVRVFGEIMETVDIMQQCGVKKDRSVSYKLLKVVSSVLRSQ